MNLHIFNAAKHKAEKEYDGHLTIMKFSTNWKVCFGTPSSRFEIDSMATGDTIEEALAEAIKTNCNVYDMLGFNDDEDE